MSAERPSDDPFQAVPRDPGRARSGGLLLGRRHGSVGQGDRMALREARASCLRCGAHTQAVVTRQTLSGRCGNCGGYELDLLGA